MSKRTIGADGLDELPNPQPGWFTVTVKDSSGLQAGYAYARWGECFQLGKDGRLIPVPVQNQTAVVPVDKTQAEGQGWSDER